MDDLSKLHHTDDPDTSKEAIAAFEQSGSREVHMKIVFEAVKNNPFLTAPELMQPTGLKEEYQVRRRLSDLKGKNLLSHGPKRKCQVKGTNMVTWIVSGQE